MRAQYLDDLTNERAPLCLRMSELLPNCRTVLGPWSHSWPDCSVPGPNIAYLEECLQFWTEHLKQEEVRLSWSSLPRLRWWQCLGEVAPGPQVNTWPGRWQARDRGSTGDTLTYRWAHILSIYTIIQSKS